MNPIKSIIIFFILFLFFGVVYSQDLEGFYKKQQSIQRSGLLLLGTWALGNIGVSGVLYKKSKGSTHYFHEMNIAWNTVNFAIAGIGIWNVTNASNVSLELWEIMDNQTSIEKLLLFNTGLDIGYLATGLFLLERSKNVDKNSQRLKGYGHSLLLQGGFLLIFDSLFYTVISHHGNTLPSIFEHLTISPSGLRLYFLF